MAISISPDLEQRLHQVVEEGKFSSIDEFLETSLQLFHSEEEYLSSEELDLLREEIEQAVAEADAGDAREFTLPELLHMVREP